MRLAVIPARGGSKRIPRKNIREFCGKPMIAWSIEAARVSGCFDRILVSTDDEEIAAVARQHGAETPFVRPAELANDHAGTTPVVQHAVLWQRAQGAAPAQVCCLYATAPFVQAADLREGLRLLESEADLDYVFTCTHFPSPPQRALGFTPQGRVRMFEPRYELTRSQDLAPAFHDAGQFYWGTAAAFAEARAIYSTAAKPLLLPRSRVQDIDTLEDWAHAELLFKVQSLEHSTGTRP